MLTRSETERGTEGMIGEGGNDKRGGETEEEQKRMEKISEKGRMISGRKRQKTAGERGMPAKHNAGKDRPRCASLSLSSCIIWEGVRF